MIQLKVSHSALQNAESIASMILTTESLVTDKKETKKNAAVEDMTMQQIWVQCVNNLINIYYVELEI